MSCIEAGTKRKVFILQFKAKQLEAITWGKNCQQIQIKLEKPEGKNSTVNEFKKNKKHFHLYVQYITILARCIFLPKKLTENI